MFNALLDGPDGIQIETGLLKGSDIIVVILMLFLIGMGILGIFIYQKCIKKNNSKNNKK